MRAATAAVGRVEPARAARAPWLRLVRVRALLQRLVLFPILAAFCGRIRVRGVPASGPVVFVANHASHADTAVLLRALPASVRRRTMPAAAEDYFFASRRRAWLTRALVGAFPFPRRGEAGLARASAVLRSGGCVLMFPEGTRSLDGTIGRFRTGVGVLASAGATVVPVGIAGTHEVIAKGRRLPRRSSVAVSFGAPVRAPGEDPARIALLLEQRVRALAADAASVRRPRRPLLDRARALAVSRVGLAVAFAWGAAEALVFPVVPDVAVVLLGVAAPRRAVPLALAALAGSATGGGAAYAAGAAVGSGALAHAPLVTERMVTAAGEWLRASGAEALQRQPLSGIPFKVFGFQAAEAGVPPAAFLAHAVAARGARLLAVAALFAVPAALLQRWARALYAPFVAAFVVVFSFGLARVVASWS